MLTDLITTLASRTEEGFVFFNDVIFGALKRAYGYEIFKGSDHLIREYVHLIEKKTFVKLHRLQMEVYLHYKEFGLNILTANLDHGSKANREKAFL